jgi:hypothetical protein
MSGIIAATTSSSPSLVIGLVALVLDVIAFWMIFAKAGRPGWAAIIPFYNLYTMCKVAGRPGWWWILFLIPFVNIVVAFIVYIDIAKAFGKGTGFGILLVFFTIICALILGLGSSTYTLPERARA